MAYPEYIPNSIPTDPDLTLPEPQAALGKDGELTYICCKCRLPVLESDVQFYQGKPYGISCSCAADIAQLIGRGK